MQENLILAGYDEETAKRLSEAKYTAARPPARPVCHMNQRGRKR